MFSTFANYSLDIYFLQITATKVAKFIGSDQNTRIPTILVVRILG